MAKRYKEDKPKKEIIISEKTADENETAEQAEKEEKKKAIKFPKFKKENKHDKKTPAEVIIRESSDDIPDEDYYTAEEDISEERREKLRTALEGAEIDEIGPQRKHLSVKTIVCLSIIIFAVALSVLLWLNRDRLSPARIVNWFQTSLTGGAVGDGYPISVTGTNVDTDNFMTADGNCVALSDTALSVNDSLGNSTFTIGHSYNEPALSYSYGKYLLYNMGGTGFTLLTDGDDAEKKNAEDKISAGAISGNGRYALLEQPADYTCDLNVYDSNSNDSDGIGDKLLYTFHFAENYGVAVALNSDGSKGAVATVSSDRGELYTEITILDFAQPEPVASFISAGNLVTELMWGDNGMIYAVGDTKTVICTRNNEFTEYDYGGKTVTAVSLAGSKAYVSVSGYEHNGPSTLLVFSSAEAPLEIPLENIITDISSYGSVVSVLCDNTVRSFDSGNGEAIASVESGYDAKGLAMTDESHSYVLGVNQIRYVALVNKP